MDIVLEDIEWSVQEIQGIQSLDREHFRNKNQDTSDNGGEYTSK